MIQTNLPPENPERFMSHRPDQAPFVVRVRDLAATRTQYGYYSRTIISMTRLRGW